MRHRARAAFFCQSLGTQVALPIFMEAAFLHTLDSVPLRLLISLLAGIALGFEREERGRIAGLKTTVLVCLASCVAMIVSTSLLIDTDADSRFDPSRIATGVLSGIGFLGAGVIIRQGKMVQGVTTAAVLWLTAIIGLAIGCGFVVLGMGSVAMALLLLKLTPHLEHYIKNESFATLMIRTSNPGVLPGIRDRLTQAEVLVDAFHVDFDASGSWTYHFNVNYRSNDLYFADGIVAKLNELPLDHVSWQ